MIGRLALAAVAAATALVPAAPSSATALAASCSVSLAGPSQCVYLAPLLTLSGTLTLHVTGGYVAVAGVQCAAGGAADSGFPGYSHSQSFTRAGVCVLQISGSGTATASAN